jgi:predicted amidophosphoribosyltransferase
MSVFKKYVSHQGKTAHCPECRESISQEANICPHCRSNLKENEAWQNAKAEATNSGPGCSAMLVFSFIGISALAKLSHYLIT